MTQLQIRQTQPQADQCVLEVRGEIDLGTIDSFKQALRAVVDNGGWREVSVDMAQVDFIGSPGVATLVNAASALKTMDRRLRIVNIRPQVRRIFKLINIEHLIAG